MLIQTDIYQMPEFNKNMGWITKIMGAFYMVFAIFCESNYFKIKIEKVPTMFMLRKKGQIISSEGFFFSVTSSTSNAGLLAIFFNVSLAFFILIFG